MNKLIKTAFTLIELLVVIAIIGILSGLIVISMKGSIDSANDAKRKAGIDTIKKALVIYSALNGGVYPIQGTPCNIGQGGSCLTAFTNAIAELLPTPPVDPVSGYYTYVSNGTSYTISAILSNANYYNYSPVFGITSGKSCLSILKAGESTGNGVYSINLTGTAIQVYCDMTSYGGGWTLVTKISVSDQNQYFTAANNIGDLAVAPSTVAPTRSAKLSDLDLDYLIGPGSVRWVIVGDNATFLRCTGVWTSNFGVFKSCSYSNNYYDAFAAPNATPIWESFTSNIGACGGGSTSSGWTALSGIHNGDGYYMGGYSGSSTSSVNQAIAAYSISGYTANDSWTYPGYVFIR